jgi:hypothetical protein
MTVNTRVRTLAAALLLGGAILGFSTGPATAAPSQRDDQLCTMEDTDANHIEFYLPGERVAMPGLGVWFECRAGGDDGYGYWDDGGPIEQPERP